MAVFQWDYSVEVDTGWDYRHNVGTQGYPDTQTNGHNLGSQGGTSNFLQHPGLSNNRAIRGALGNLGLLSFLETL